MKNTLKTFKETQIPNTPYNWHIWKRAYAMGYKESEKVCDVCGCKGIDAYKEQS